jgi:DNA invertase Pin-like site-specific DNA recombinase
MTKAKTDEARRMYDSGDYTWEEIGEMFGVSRMTVYRHVVKSRDDAR